MKVVVGVAMLRTMLDRLFVRPDRNRAAPGRLDADQAACIAARAAAAAGFPGTVGYASPVRTEAGLVWDACQVSYGSGWRVAVDDATGRAGVVGRWGLR